MRSVAKQMKIDGFAGKVEKLDLSRYLNTEKFPEDDKQLLTCFENSGSGDQ